MSEPPKGSNGKERELFRKFQVQKFLGKGSYGSVYRVKRISDGLVYALKEADVSRMSQLERMDAVNEVRLLASMKHMNVVRYHEAFIDSNWLCIIMEFATNGDLSRFIKKGRELKKPFPEDVIWKFFIQILMGVQVLHNNKIIHRDIKPMNIFVGDSDVVKVGDLGIAKKLKGGLAHTQIGTPHYMPPEIWKSRPYSYETDMWSLGCLLYEMMTYKVPFDAKSINELKTKVVAGRYQPIPAGKYSSDLIKLCSSLMDLNPAQRPTIDQVLTSPAVTKKMHLMPRSASERRRSEDGAIMDTIKVPKDIRLLKGRLPKPDYQSDKQLPPINKTPASMPSDGNRRRITFS